MGLSFSSSSYFVPFLLDFIFNFTDVLSLIFHPNKFYESNIACKLPMIKFQFLFFLNDFEWF